MAANKEEIAKISGTVQDTVIYGDSASLGHTARPYYELHKLLYGHSALTTLLSLSRFVAAPPEPSRMPCEP